MSLLKKITIIGAFAGISLILPGCNVVFPDVIEEDNVTAAAPVPQKTIEEGDSLPAAEQPEAVKQPAPAASAAEQPEAAKTVPVMIAVADNTSAPDTKEEAYVEPQPQAQPEVFSPSVTYRSNIFYFENGSSALDGKYAADIGTIADIAKKNKARIYVYGYASSRTGNTDMATHKLTNFNVSLERAQNVANALKRAGIKDENIYTEALSDTNPAYLEVMPEGDRLNRRAEVYISY